MHMSKPISTTLASHFKLSELQMPQSMDEVEHMSKVPYASTVGSIMYAMVCTHPDIAQSVSLVSRYMTNPGKKHWEAVKWILRYLKGASDVGLTFRKSEGISVLGYVDSDNAGDLDRRRSTTGYIFTFVGSVVSWKSALQSIVSLSTTEAEYMAATEAVKEAIWNILKSLSLAYGQMILRSGFFHADPHPGNILICKGAEASMHLFVFFFQSGSQLSYIIVLVQSSDKDHDILFLLRLHCWTMDKLRIFPKISGLDMLILFLLLLMAMLLGQEKALSEKFSD
ncbi:hypothetical protein MTR67_030269 [Solanum verrucosum]|uniref:ABC1 atypical kinase-like domain-containing protein n=1 Tax=Solanum verrucosum TaxID=315347 RepID=A0AAF0R5Q5_SOLVR|nr:hypothetical protein MTR67_030269 [Solanum verrucosum]